MTATRGLGTIHIEWLEETRKISAETAAKLGLYTARLSKNSEGEWSATPDLKGTVLVFPYTEKGSTVNEKWRLPEKKFMQTVGGRRTFFNSDIIDDPTLTSGCAALIITEGEPDALAALECDLPFTVSIPDGARTPSDEPPKPPTEEEDRSGKFEFMWNNRARLKRVRRFILAMDNDDAGKRMLAEMVMRLGASRCRFVEYPEGCKDTNDVLMKHGKEAVLRMFDNAKQMPVRGLYRVADYPPPPKFTLYSTGMPNCDSNENKNAFVYLFDGAFVVVTGIPQMGKSTLVMNICVELWRRYGMRSAVFSPEMPTLPHMQAKLRRIIGGSTAEADAAIDEAFVFIDEQDDDDLESDLTIDWIIDRATEAVERDSIKVLVVDPWNEVEHFRGRGESLVEYISRTLRKLRRFGRKYGIIVFVCCHPTKDVFDGKKGSIRVPTLYDCDGGAMWFNKADIGLCVHRPDPFNNLSALHIQKIKFDETGRRGVVNMQYDIGTLRYTMVDERPKQDEFPLRNRA